MDVEFEAWPKIPRHKGANVIISEKIDGTNSAIIIRDGVVVGCQSRNRLITPENDNFGFARWVSENGDELAGLGDGRHFGEWAGPGIQKNPHGFSSKKFMLFNTSRWAEDKPPCCDVVSVLYSGEIGHDTVGDVMSELRASSLAAGYKAEGVIIYYVNTRTFEKATFDNPNGKWARKLAA